MRLVFATLLDAAMAVLAGCDTLAGDSTAVRVTVTVDGRPAARADARLLARDPASPFEAYTETLARGRSRGDGRVALLVLDDRAVPGVPFATASRCFRPTACRASGACSRRSSPARTPPSRRRSRSARSARNAAAEV